MAEFLGQERGNKSAGMKVVWSRRAIRHLVRLRIYIKKDSEQNAALVATRIFRAVDLLQARPEMGRPGRVVGTRELVVPEVPFIIPYRSARTPGADRWFSRAPEMARRYRLKVRWR